MNARNVKLIGIVIIALIAVVGYFFIVSPFIAQQSEHNQRVEEAEARIAEAETALISIERDAAITEEVGVLDQEMSNMFPSTADINTLRSQIYAAAASAGVTVNINSVPPVVIQEAVQQPAETEETEDGEPAPPAPNEQESAAIAQFGISVTAEGGLNQVMQLLDQMNTITRGVLVTSASISGEEGQYRLTFEATSFIHDTTAPPTTSEDGTVEEGVDENDQTEEGNNTGETTEETASESTN